MRFKNTSSKYGIVTKAFHWIIAILFIMQYYWIFMRNYIYESKSKEGLSYLIDYHKPTGVVLLVLGILFVAWKFINIKPRYPKGMPYWEKSAAKMVQILLYLSILLMPLSGTLMSVLSGRSINMYGLFTIPAASEPNKELAGFFHDFHEYMAIFIIAIFTVHVCAALKHHFYDKDNILKRMIPFD